ncbi:hypothetical protein HYW58_02175 [Candidatus Kaiserbacteria bacterium]|nr:hypothetical protein [Candidatus Kaiserbacteria bacterium]
MIQASSQYEKYAVLPVAALVILVIGGFQLNRDKDAFPYAALTETGVYEVKLTENGFEPSRLTVPPGATVVFTTELEKYFWPASNLHPSHTIYPEFDPKKPIAPNAEWQFSFEKSGVWAYHDHLAPYFTGTVIVIDEAEKVFNENSCESDTKYAACWRSTLFSELEAHGIDAVFDMVHTFYIQDEKFREGCHGVAHDIGVESYKYFIKDRDSILTEKASACAYGFYHGFMEALLTTTGDIKKARGFCLYIDTKITPHAPDTTLQCFHGIGHGVVDLELRLNGPRQNVETLAYDALKLCEEASKSPDELYRCTSGVYNNIANAYIDRTDSIQSRKDILELCRTQPSIYKESCYGNINALLLRSMENNLDKALPLLGGIEEEYKESSVRYLSNLSIVYNGMLEGNEYYKKNVAICRTLKENLHKACLQGYVHGLLEHGVPGYEYKEAINFCASDYLENEEKNTCFSYAISNLSGWYEKSKAENICSTVQKEYQRYCEPLRY